MTVEQLRERCAYWQKCLRLQDWDITVSVVRQWDVPGAFGTCEAMLSKKVAKIKILDSADDGDPADFEPFDQEKTLVHELLHVHFAGFEAKNSDSPQGIAQHQAIQALTHALMAFERRSE